MTGRNLLALFLVCCWIQNHGNSFCIWMQILLIFANFAISRSCEACPNPTHSGSEVQVKNISTSDLKLRGSRKQDQKQPSLRPPPLPRWDVSRKLSKRAFQWAISSLNNSSFASLLAIFEKFCIFRMCAKKVPCFSAAYKKFFEFR